MFDKYRILSNERRAMTRRTVKASDHEGKPTPARGRKVARNIAIGEFKGVAAEIMKKAKASGLLNEKGSRITGRVSKVLVEQAKRRTGITENTQLIEFALASLALEDNFAEAFKSVKGAVDPDIELGF
ncbi:hypothetical protein [Bosea sp. CS1GBMeth4]|uniref:hypothetical protein n=1 Tax=Bosea sp. CS1GBMeth4 TaxID=1892849 RepID=UPI001FCE350B|nr:hypothetical protein [Bosea sp. CS1GBMeth4]